MPSPAALAFALAAESPGATDPASSTKAVLHRGHLFEMDQGVGCPQDGRAVRE
jgi:hypothetical protein